MRLALVGISHHGAPVELRERVALGSRQAAELARSSRRRRRGGLPLDLQPHRALPRARRVAERARRWRRLALLAAASRELAAALYRLRDEAAALHLFRVAAGLDSLVPGEGEILGQVRAAFEAGATGPLLDRLFRQALHAGRKVRAETAIGESPASVSSAAAALAQQVFGDLDGRRVLLVGAGKIERARRAQPRSRAARRSRSSRTASRERAARARARASAREALAARAASRTSSREADVVVSSTSAPGFVLAREQVERGAAARARAGRCS